MTVRYVDGKPVGVTQIVLSTQHVDEDLTSEDVREIVEPYIVAALPEGWIPEQTVWHVNPTGKFVIGGPDGDTGLTGRKIIVDTYGGAAPHGGGAFSGKDPDQGGSLGRLCRPLSGQERRRGRSCRSRARSSSPMRSASPSRCRFMSMRTGPPRSMKRSWKTCCSRSCACRRAASASISASIVRSMRAPSAYGHFGREPDAEGGFSWEKTDLVDKLKAHFA